MRGLRTEHAGPKRGRGHWGTKAEAKRLSRKQRRADGKRAAARVGGTPSTPSA